MNKNIFFYDGECPFCTYLANSLKEKCTEPDIKFLSFRNLDKNEIYKIHPKLTFDRLEGEVQFIYKEVRYPGFFAIRRLSHFLKGYRYFSVILYLPFIPFIGMFSLWILRKIKNRVR